MLGFGKPRARDPEKEALKLKKQFSVVSSRFFRAQWWRKFWRKWTVPICMAFGFAVVFETGLLLSPWPQLETLRHIAAAPNCSAARLVKLAPAQRGEPGYYVRHDRDRDGVACEPIPANR